MRLNDERSAERGTVTGSARPDQGPIVVDVDSTETGWRAIAWADQEAECRGVTVRVLSGLGPDGFFAAARDASMLVVDSVGFLRMCCLTERPRAIAVAVRANVLVVVRPEPAAAPAGRSAGRVVVGVDGSELSAAAIGFAFAEARDHECGLTLVHAVDSEDERGAAEEMLASLSAGHPNVRAVVVVDLASHTLVEESAGARLVVVGSRGQAGGDGMLLGSVSQAVLHRARCPVALVRE